MLKDVLVKVCLPVILRFIDTLKVILRYNHIILVSCTQSFGVLLMSHDIQVRLSLHCKAVTAVQALNFEVQGDSQQL